MWNVSSDAWNVSTDTWNVFTDMWNVFIDAWNVFPDMWNVSTDAWNVFQWCVKCVPWCVKCVHWSMKSMKCAWWCVEICLEKFQLHNQSNPETCLRGGTEEVFFQLIWTNLRFRWLINIGLSINKRPTIKKQKDLAGIIEVGWVSVISVLCLAYVHRQMGSIYNLLFTANKSCFWLIWHTYQWAYAIMICPLCVIVIIVIVGIIGVICVQLSQWQDLS